MGQTGDYPPVTKQLLDEVVRRVLLAGSPHTIVVFGSRARGDARPDSDLDLLIIEDSDLPRYERSPRYYHALAGVFPAKDIVVYTPDEVNSHIAVPPRVFQTEGSGLPPSGHCHRTRLRPFPDQRPPVTAVRAHPR